MIIKEKTELPPSEKFIKVVVDIERKILAYGCELHVDCADELIQDGSSGGDLWGANVYPDTGRIDFVSLINIRPAAGNRTMEIQSEEIKNAVEMVIRDLSVLSE
ncbi:MAG: DUF5674 family protein [Patescibacteria group bacterium]